MSAHGTRLEIPLFMLADLAICEPVISSGKMESRTSRSSFWSSMPMMEWIEEGGIEGEVCSTHVVFSTWILSELTECQMENDAFV